MGDQQGFVDGEPSEIRGMIDKTTSVAEVEAVEQPHPLQPLENHLNGSSHNASAAIKALDDWFEKKFAAALAVLKLKEEDA